MVELRQLKYFVKVAQLEHFGQAARDLHVVQPALSRQIKQLEEELDVLLFERLPRGVRLTAAGKMLLQRSEPLLAEIDDILMMTKLANLGKIGKLRIGFADGATYSGHVPEIIGEFRRTNPDVQLELIQASSIAQGRMLMQESIDIGFVYWLPRDSSKALRDRNRIEHHELIHEQVVLAAAGSNKLAKKSSIRLADLKGCPFVWFNRDNSPNFHDLISDSCSKAGLTLNVVQEATTESTMLSLVSADIGVTFITESARGRKPENVVLLKVKDLKATITVMAMWRAKDDNPVLREFLKVVKEKS